MPDVNTAIVYDGDPDGFGCAYAAYKKFGEDADYYEVEHGQDLPVIAFTYENVYIFDLCFDWETMEELTHSTRDYVVIDHHPSAQETVEGLDLNPVPFDTSRAACVQVWEYFFPEAQDTPKILQYVADRDVWKFELPYSEEMNSFIYLHPRTIMDWDYVESELQHNFQECITIGQALYTQKGVIAKEMADRNDFVRASHFTGNPLDHGDVPVAAAPAIWSEVGHELLNMYPDAPFACTYFDFEGRRKYSLRSEDHRMDVGAIAKRLGGGGHRNAAGFSVGFKALWHGQANLYMS